MDNSEVSQSFEPVSKGNQLALSSLMPLLCQTFAGHYLRQEAMTLSREPGSANPPLPESPDGCCTAGSNAIPWLKGPEKAPSRDLRLAQVEGVPFVQHSWA